MLPQYIHKVYTAKSYWLKRGSGKRRLVLRELLVKSMYLPTTMRYSILEIVYSRRLLFRTCQDMLPNMKKRTVVITFAILILLGLGWFLVEKKKDEELVPDDTT